MGSESLGETTESGNDRPPNRVKMVPRMELDVAALEALTKDERPPKRTLRPIKEGAIARYYFGDASGAGFGMSGWTPGDDLIEVDFGSWDQNKMAKTSSNFRELANIVMKVEQMFAEGKLNGLSETFIFTDNMHAESAFYRGTAKSPEVLRLMLRLHKILMHGDVFIHVVWVAGKRMIVQGTDGLSRSDLTSGVMRGEAMLDFVPLHKTAQERQPRVISELLNQILGDAPDIVSLEPQEWFSRPQRTDGTFIWTPPPCIAEVAVFLIAEAWHLRPWNTHVLLTPSLLSGRWRRMLTKTCDLFCVMPFSADCWPKESEHEPLTLAFVFPLLNSRPWRVNSQNFWSKEEMTCARCTGSLCHTQGIVCANFGHTRGHWTPCRAAFHGPCYVVPWTVDPFPRNLQPRLMEQNAEGTLVEEAEGWETTEAETADLKKLYCEARAGDHFITPFQCELCHFRNICKRNPDMTSAQDKWLIQCIIRANLDAFWARQPSTVQGNLRQVNKLMTILHQLRIDSPSDVFVRGPFPVTDSFGMIPAVASLQRSLDSGRNSKTVQWDTMCGIRTAYSNFVHTTPLGLSGAVLSDGRKSTRITESSSNSLWFKRFMDGCHERMGDVKLQDPALSIDVLLALQELLKIKLESAKEARDEKEQFQICVLGAVLTLGFSSGLRGEELGHVRLNDTLIHTVQGLKHPKRRHVLLALEGRFKGVNVRQKHKIPLVPVTASGISNVTWLVELLLQYEAAGTTVGPLFRHHPTSERAITIRQLDVWLHSAMTDLQDQRPDLLGENTEDITKFSVRRSIRRGSTTQARNKKIPKNVVDLNNRWRTQESAGARFAHANMIDLYTDVVAALET